MIIKQLTMCGFRSVKSPITIDLITLPIGLILLTGDNQVEPELGANGVGKSTIAESIVWTLFGKTSNNLRGNIIKNRNYRNTYCTLKFEIDEQEYILTRTQSPNKIELNDRVVTDEDIERVTGFNFMSFLYSVYISQFGSKFFDNTPGQKMTIMNELLEDELKRWTDYSDKSDQILRVTSEEESALLKIRETAEIGWHGNKTIDTIKENSDRWLKTRTEKLQSLSVELENLENSIGTTRIKKVNAKYTQKQVDNLQKTLDDIENKYTKDNELLTTYKVKISLLNESMQNQDAKQRNLETLTDRAKCPTCGSKLDKVQIRRMISDIAKERIASEELLEELRFKRNELEDETIVTKSKISVNTTLIRDMKDDLSKAEIDKQKRLTEIEYIEKDINRLEKELRETRNSVNPYEEELLLAEKKSNRIKDTIRRIEEYRLPLVEKEAQLEECKQIFKDMRLFVMRRFLDELQIHINNVLHSIGMSDWTIELSIENETQSGNIRREITVLVNSPHGGGKVPLESWSGGESQRLKLAGTIGLMNFIYNRRNVNCNIEIFDEPTTWLSEQGINQLLDVLHFRAAHTNKIILLADHRNFSTFGRFAHTIHVIKDEDGTRVEI